MNAYEMGLGVGILAGLAIYAVFTLAVRKKTGCAREYDERQIAAQGKAAKAAMFTHMAFAAACIAYYAGWEPTWLDVPTAMFFGLALSIGVYAVHCILHDAYFSISRSPRYTLWALAAVAVLQFLNVGRHVTAEGLLPDGRLDLIVGMSLACGALMLVVLATALIKLTMDRRGEREADGDGEEA
ncbi:MAG: hypothetical protein E7474_04265 [Ruminococcaceae bacterium]|nr:hypothetical protein [Oscillospiraceae bacterium]